MVQPFRSPIVEKYPILGRLKVFFKHDFPKNIQKMVQPFRSPIVEKHPILGRLKVFFKQGFPKNTPKNGPTVSAPDCRKIPDCQTKIFWTKIF